MTAPFLEPDYADPPLLAHSRTALDVARTIAQWDLASFYSIDIDDSGVSPQTGDEEQARALARALCVPGEEPRVRDYHDENGYRHLVLSVGSVRVVCFQRAGERAA